MIMARRKLKDKLINKNDMTEQLSLINGSNTNIDRKPYKKLSETYFLKVLGENWTKLMLKPNCVSVNTLKNWIETQKEIRRKICKMLEM